MKSSFATLLIAGASASYSQGERALYGPTKDFGDYQHDRVWGHGHYEPGDIERFENHHAEIYGADDLAWGPNGFANPHTHNDDHHNWDDQGDAYVCHSCGGHGCTLCGGYGHGHRNAQFGEHGHTLQTGFGVGHNHVYLGDKPRSSYNRYGHGVGGRYTQRWSNGYGNRYGIGHGHRYGLAHRWSQYNGYGHGNPSSKGSVMGYGLGANAQIPQLYQPRTYEDVYDPYDAYGDSYDYDYKEYTPKYKQMDYEQEYHEPQYYEQEYHEPKHYEQEYHEPQYYEQEYDHYEPQYDCQTGCYVQQHYEEPEYYEQEYEEPKYEEPKYEEPKYEEPEEYVEPVVYEEPEYEEAEYDEYAEPRGLGYHGGSYYEQKVTEPVDMKYFKDGFGKASKPRVNNVGRGKYYTMAYGHGSGNHSPYNGEIWRHDAGMLNYRFRPEKIWQHHTMPGYYNNQFF